MDDVKYDAHYRDDPAACGTPFKEFEEFCATAPVGSVLDLGCGQGRDTLMFARAGHRVVGVDVSSVGIHQMLEIARQEDLDVEGVVADICTYRPSRTFDIVILDRVLHMLSAELRIPVLHTAMHAVSQGGRLIIAEGAQGMTPLRHAIEQAGWLLIVDKPNRVLARKPDALAR